MDAHPIPQNVTSFQFKLVGDMTLKQFLYLAIGVGFAYLLFVTVSSKYPLITWPIIIISTLLGVAFAFLPIGSRPLDYWLAAFLKAVYSPTKRVWKKNGKNYKEDPLFESRLVMYLAGQQTQVTGDSLQATAVPQSQPIAPLPTREELGKTVDLARQAQQLQMKIIQTERTLSQIKTEAEKPNPIPIDYSQQANATLADLQSLVKQVSDVKTQIQKVREPIKEHASAATSITHERVKVIVPTKPRQTTVALTTFPNVINGIVKDTTGNYLEGTVAVIYDKEGLPVRALKSNKLGQFTGSTPLPNGTYTLELEKDNFSFDVLQIDLNGGVMSPLLIAAK
ncbi:MAG: PrgI family protein [Candidatus Daviesbacteria bacterium]|nr:PrgI family protein [Candidatus Daviesbacteria bacterium]